MFHHFTMNCIWLMLFSHELKQVLVLVKHFALASPMEMFLSIATPWIRPADTIAPLDPPLLLCNDYCESIPAFPADNQLNQNID